MRERFSIKKLGTTLYIAHESYGLCLLFLMNFLMNLQFWSPIWFHYAKEHLEYIHCKISSFVPHGRKSKRFGMTCGVAKIKWFIFVWTVPWSDPDSSERLVSYLLLNSWSIIAVFLSFFLSLPRSCSSHWVVRFCIMQSTSNFTAAFAPTTLKCRRFWKEVRHCTLPLHIWEQENRIDYFY